MLNPMHNEFEINTIEKIKIDFFSRLNQAFQAELQHTDIPELPPFPLWILLEFVKNFPHLIPKLKNLLTTQKVSLLPDFSIIDENITSLESRLQNKFLKSTAIKYIHLLSNGELDVSELLLVKTEASSPTFPEGAFSCRIEIKQLLDTSQKIMERYLAPVNCIISLITNISNQDLISALRSGMALFQNPSLVTGCCSDEVAASGTKNWQLILSESQAMLDELFRQVTTPSNEKVTVFNPSLFTRTEVVSLPLSSTDLNFNGQTVQQPLQAEFLNRTEKPENFLLKEVSIPPFGFITVDLKRTPLESLSESSLKAGYYFIENEFVKLTVEKNGSLTLQDKVRNQIYKNLNILEDAGDAGTTAHFHSPEKNKIIHSIQFEPRISLIEKDPLRATIRIRYRMRIPVGLNREQNGRSDKTDILRIRTTISLTANSPLVSIETQVKNTVRNHRLRVRFETGTTTRESLTFIHDKLTAKEHGGQPLNNIGRENDAEWPLIKWVTVADEASSHGLTLFTSGLHGYQLRLDAPRSLLLTLLRSAEKWESLISGATYSAPGAAELQEFKFNYAILPHSGKIREALPTIAETFEQFSTPLLICSGEENQKFKASENILEVSPSHLVLNSLRQGKLPNEMVVSLNNPTQNEILCSVKTIKPLQKVMLATAREQLYEEIPLNPPNHFDYAIPALASQTFVLVFEK